MSRRHGFSQILVHNNEAYELDGMELAEFESRVEKMGIEDYHPLYYKAVYDYLLELGYEIDPPDPKLCMSREEAEAKVSRNAVSADSRNKWSKEKILKERERLLNRERKLSEIESKLRRTLARESDTRTRMARTDAQRRRDFRIGEGYGTRNWRHSLGLMAEDYFDVRFRNNVRYNSNTPWLRTIGGLVLTVILGISFGVLMFLHELFMWVKTWFS